MKSRFEGRAWTGLFAALVCFLWTAAATAQIVNTTPSTKIWTAPLISPTAAASYYSPFGTTSTRNSNLTPQNEITELARSLNGDRVATFQFVRDNAETVWMYGAQKGAMGVLVDRAGTPFDQAMFMVQVLQRAGVNANYQVGTASPSPAQFLVWTGISDAGQACQLMSSGGIPAVINGTTQADCNYGGAGITSITFAHAWVQVVVPGQGTFLYDPSYKPHTLNAGLDLPTQAGLSTGQPMAQATSGMVAGQASAVNYVSTLNATLLNSKLQTYGQNIQTWLDGAGSTQSIAQVAGMPTIQPATPTELAATTLPYTFAASATWPGTVGVPDAYRTKLTVQVSRNGPGGQVSLFNTPLFVDEIYGRKLTVVSRNNGAGGPAAADTLQVVDEFGRSVTVASGPVTNDEPGFNDATFTLVVNHPYAGSTTGVADGSYMDATITKHAMMWMPLVIVHSWGSVDKRLIEKWGSRDDTTAPTPVPPGSCDTCDVFASATGDGRREQLGAAWMVQSSMAARLHAAIAKSIYTHHHSIGLVAADTEIKTTLSDPNNPNSAKYYSITDSFDRLDVDTAFSLTSTVPGAAATRRAAVHAIADTLETLEGAVSAQISDLPDTTSAAMRFEWGNKPLLGVNEDNVGGGVSRKVYDFTNATDAAQAPNLMRFESQLSASGSAIHGRLAPTIDSGESSAWESAVASAIQAYAGIPGFDVVASEESFLGPGQRAGAFQFNAPTLYTHLPTHQRGGVLIATRYVAGDPVEIAHIAVGRRDRAKGGGGGAQSGHQSQYDPSKAADALKGRFVDHSQALGVDLLNGEPTYTSPASLSVGQGEFPYKLDAQLIWRGGQVKSDLFGPIDHTAPQAPWTTNWNNTLTVSGSGVEAMGDTDARTAAGTLAAFVALQDVYKSAPSASREVTAALVSAWWAHQLSGNVVTVNVGAGTQQFVRRIAGDFLSPGAGAFAKLAQSGQRQVFTNDCGKGVYVQTRGWDYSGINFDITRANGDVQHFGYWTNHVVNGTGYCNDFHGFRLTTWTFPQGPIVTVAYSLGANGLDVLNNVTNNLGRRINFVNGGVTAPGQAGGFTNGLSGADLRTVSISTDGSQHTDPNNKVTTFAVSYTNSLDVSSRYHLDAVFAADDPSHAALAYTYDTVGRVATAKDRLGVLGSRNAYEFRIAEGLRGERKDPLGQTFSVIYDINKHPLKFTDERGFATAATYDGRGRVNGYTYPEGDQEQFQYDNQNNTLQLTKVSKTPGTPANIVIQATWDPAWNKPLSITDALNNQTTFTYAPAGTFGASLMLTATRPIPIAAGTHPVYTFNYNSLGQLVTSQDPTGLVVSNGYDSSTHYLTTTTTDPSGVSPITTTFTTNALGDPTLIDGPRTDVVDASTIGYDNMRRKTLEVQPEVGDGRPVAKRTTYDAVGRVTLEEQGFGNFSPLRATAYGYDPVGNKTAEVTSAGGLAFAETDYAYDALNRVTCTAARMNSASFNLSLPGCSLGVEGAFGPDRVTLQTYDPVGNPLATTKGYLSPLSVVFATNTWSANGKRTGISDAENNLTTYAYDGFDRLTQVRYPSTSIGSGTSSTTDFDAYTYDANGNRLTWRNRSASVTTYAYDTLDREISKIPAVVADSVYSTYDNAGRLTFARLNNSGGVGTQYVYDSAGRLHQEISFSRSLTSDYDKAGNRIQLTWPDGYFANYDYDAAGRLTKVRENGATSGAGVLAAFSYGDLNQRSGIARGNGTAATYGYDPIGRLNALTQGANGATAASVQSAAFNPASQIVYATQAANAYVWTGHPTSTTSWTFNGLNKDAAIVAISGGYDTRGNLGNDGTHKYVYDQQNRLTKVTDLAGASLLAVSYDPTDRIRQTTAGTTATQFLYDGDRLVAEYNGTTLLRRYVHGAGVDEPLVWYEGSDRRWLHADRQGSIIGYSTATATSTYTYGPYGEPQDWSGSRFRYTGQIALPEVGLYFYKARVYDPVRGWFLQTDPIGQQDDPNLYAYVKDDPTNSADPTGLDAELVLIGYTIGSAPVQGPFGHAYVLIKDTDTGKSYVARAGPYGPQAFNQGSLGSRVASDAPTFGSYLNAELQPESQSIDRNAQLNPKINNNPEVISSFTIRGDAKDVLKEISDFNSRTNEQEVSYRARSTNSNLYSFNLWRILTGQRVVRKLYPGSEIQPTKPDTRSCAKKGASCAGGAGVDVWD